MKPNCHITISRQGERPQKFEGEIIRESSTHYLIKHDREDVSGDGAEWLPKNSRATTCVPYTNNEKDEYERI